MIILWIINVLKESWDRFQINCWFYNCDLTKLSTSTEESFIEIFYITNIEIQNN